MRRLLLTTAFLVAGVLPCLAGVSFTAVARGSDQQTDESVRVLVSGDKARLEFIAAGEQPVADGEYMLSRDQGKTVYTVSPRTRTYSQYEVRDMFASLGGLVRGLRGKMHMEFQSPTVEKLLEEDGGIIAGLPTRHYRLRTTYVTTVHVGEDRTLHTTREEDIWTTTQLSDPALAVWLTAAPPSTGDAQFDQIVRDAMHKVPGFPLKRVTITRTVTGDGREQIARGEMEVTDLKSVELADSLFQIPEGYTKVEPRADQDSEPEDKP